MRKRMITLAAAVVAAIVALTALAGCGKANQFDGTKWYRVSMGYSPEVYMLSFDDKEATEYKAVDEEYEHLYNPGRDIEMVRNAYYDFLPLCEAVAPEQSFTYTVKDDKWAMAAGKTFYIEDGNLYADGEPYCYPSPQAAIDAWRAEEGIVSTDSWEMPSEDEVISTGKKNFGNKSGLVDDLGQVLYDDGEICCVATATTSQGTAGYDLYLTLSCDRPRYLRTVLSDITNGENTNSKSEMVDWAVCEANDCIKSDWCHLMAWEIKDRDVSATLTITDMITGEQIGQVPFTLGKDSTPTQESAAQETASTAASNIDTSTYKMDGVVDYVRSSVKDWSDKYTQSDDLYEVILANEDVIAVVAGIGTCEYEGAPYPAFFLWSYSLNDDVKNLTIELTNLQKDGITMHDESVTIDKSYASGPFLNETNVIDSYDGVTGTITIKNADTGEVLGQDDFTI